MGALGRVVAVVVLVGLFGGVPAASVVAQETSAPGRVGRLGDVSVMRGAVVDVEASGGFSGVVDSYDASSSDGGVATVSVAGSVMSISGVSAGFADITVTATNTGGSSSQWFSVAVLAPPAPRRAIVLADQATTAGAVVAFDLTPVFSGTVTSYSATSSDTAVLEASVDESIVVLRGVAAGSATATITATNDGSSTSQTVTVTVGAAAATVAAPQAVGTLTAQDVAIGATADVDVSGGFSGTVTGYIAVTADAAVVTAAPTTLGTIRLTGVASGATTVRVVAVGAGGIAAQTLDAAVAAVAITATAPSHCLTGEGVPITIGANTGRTGIATIDVTYTVSGGTAPYTITSPATATTASAASGTLTISCAQTGIDLTNVAPTANAVESGPKTITVTATDTNNNTATTTITIQIVEDAASTDDNGGTMTAGNTYVLGTADNWTIITLPTGLNLQFEGHFQSGDDPGVGYFRDVETGSLLLLEWESAIEVARFIESPAATSRGRSDTARQTRDVGALFTDLANSRVKLTGLTFDPGQPLASMWRPYAGLPSTARVAVHPKMQQGVTLKVCNATRSTDFDPDDFADDIDADKSASDLRRDVASSLVDSVTAWNRRIGHQATLGGARHQVFRVVSDSLCDDADTEYTDIAKSDIIVHRRLSYDDTAQAACKSDLDNANDLALTEAERLAAAGAYSLCIEPYSVDGHKCDPDHRACAIINPEGSLPPKHEARYPLHIILTDTSTEFFDRDLTHELGHFLGLADYGDEDCPKNDRGVEERSLYSYLTRCMSTDGNLISDRDVLDLHAIYHPDALVDLRVASDRSGIRGWPARDTGNNFEYNAYRLILASRQAGTLDEYSVLGGANLGIIPRTPDGRALAERLGQSAGRIHIDFPDAPDGTDPYDPTGLEFRVVGVTRGDVRRGLDAHSELMLTLDDVRRWWTLGTPASVFGPPAVAPSSPIAIGRTGEVTVSWGPVPGATRYVVYYAKSTVTSPTGTTPAAELLVDDSTPQASDDRVSLSVSGLDDGDQYHFVVRAYVDTFPSGLSAEVTATPLGRPTVTAGTPMTTSVVLSWAAIGGATGYKVKYWKTGMPTTSATESVPVTSASRRSVTVDELSPDTNYTFAVWAVNSNAVSSQHVFYLRTAATTVTPPVSVVPAVPVIDTSRTAATHDSATVYWTTTDTSAGLSFKVRHRVKPAAGTTVAWDDDGVAAQHSDRHGFSGLTATTTYEVQVRAVRGTAASTWSSTVEVTTSAAPAVVPPVAAPGNLQVTTTAKEAVFTWGAVAGATGYRVRLGTSGNGTLKSGASSTSHTFGSLISNTLTPDTSYTFGVKTVQGDRSSAWESTTARTKKLTVDGRAQIRRISATTVGGWTLELVFRPTGGDRIRPTLRFTKLSDLETTWQYTSPAEMTVDGRTRQLGRVAYRKTTATEDRIELGFRLNDGTVLRPRPNEKDYSAMVQNRWYQTAEFTIELSNTAAARAGDDQDTELAGRLAGGLAPDEETCTTCDAGEADMDAPLDEPPLGDATP